MSLISVNIFHFIVIIIIIFITNFLPSPPPPPPILDYSIQLFRTHFIRKIIIYTLRNKQNNQFWWRKLIESCRRLLLPWRWKISSLQGNGPVAALAVGGAAQPPRRGEMSTELWRIGQRRRRQTTKAAAAQPLPPVPRRRRRSRWTTAMDEGAAKALNLLSDNTN